MSIDTLNFLKEREQFADAIEKRLISVKRIGDSLYTRFNPIRRDVLPDILTHMTFTKNDRSINEKGLLAREKKVYLQTPDLQVEPDGVSLLSKDKTLLKIDRDKLLATGVPITLDPESLHGIPGEYLHAFIAHGDVPPTCFSKI